VLPHFAPRHPSATTAGAAPLRLLAESLEQLEQPQPPAPASADEGGALCRALLRRQGSDAQRVLLLLAMLRAVGFRAKLVSSLHPPPRSAPKGKAAQAAGGKSGKVRLTLT